MTCTPAVTATAPTVSATFSPSSITTASSSSSTLSIVITNTNASSSMTSVGLNATTLPSGATYTAGTPTCSAGGTPGTISLSGTALSYSGATLASGTSATCTIPITAKSSTGGTKSFTTGTVFGTVSGSTYTSSAGATSNTLTIAPDISTQPSSTSVTAGASPTFTVATTASSPTYQWQVSTNGGSSYSNVSTGYTGGNTATLTATSVTTGQNGYKYQAIVTSGGQNTTSSAATLTVTAADPTPTLTFTTPTAATVDLNGSLTNAASSSIPGGGAITYGSGTPGKATVNITTGAITPVATGTSVITATQAASAGVNSTGTQTYTLTVNAAVVATQAVASTTLTQNSATGLPFTPVTGSGGTGTLTYALYNAGNSALVSLPAGLSFSTSDGHISGTPSATQSATTYTVRVTDSATSPTTVTSTFALTVAALTASTTTLTSSVNPTATASPGNQTALTATVTSGATGTVTFKDGGANVTCTEGAQPIALSGGTATCTTSFSSAATHSLTAVYSGDSSYATSTSNTVSQPVLVHPTVNSISPTGGSTGGGASVTITGTNFVSGRTYTATFGSTTAAATYASATTLTATTPAVSAGAASVTVADTTSATTISGTGSATYTYVAAPTITNVSPSSGSTGGSTSVTITGTNLSTTSGITFGGTAGTGVSCSATSCSVTTPLHAAGAVDVVVTATGGTATSTGGYTYVAAPLASSFTYGSTVTYNTGSASATSIDVSSHATNSPTGYAVGSATTAQGGSVSINSSGVASYTPASGFRGNDSFTFTASNTGGTSSSATVTVPVGNPTLTASVSGTGATQGTALSGYSITPSGGKAAYTCNTSPTGLPGGVSLASNCTLSGTPTANGTFTVSDSITDSSTGTGPYTQAVGSINFTVAAADPTPTLTFTTPTAATVDLNGSLTNAASSSIPGGGAINYGSGTPGKATVNSTTGAITPVATGTSVITATQAASAGVNSTGTQTYTVTVNAAVVATQAVASITLTSGTAVTPFTPVTGSGGTGTLTYALYNAGNSATASLPAGLSFSTSTGQITGTPTATQSATTYTVRVTDSATSPTTVTSTFALTVNAAAPTVSGISPSSGTTLGGAAVTITGTGFTGATGVSIGGTAATSVTVVSSTLITATTPAGTAGTASVVVTTPAGSNVANSLYTYVTPAPTVSGISPSSGTTLGGAAVTITGTGFTGATGVSIGGTAATSVTVVSATSITATTPAGTAGTASVVVTTPAGSNAANSLYTYVTPAPTVSGISPSSGTTLGGAAVTITGTGFTGATGVSIGGTAATSVTVVSSTSITATTPAGTSGTASVVVTTPAGSNVANSLYTYVTPAPTVSGISPSSGTTLGGAAVTITGTGFTGATGVSIGGTAATSVTVVSATSITATTPAGTAGTASVVVTTPAGSNTANSLYTYVTPAPTVSGISPSSGTTLGGAAVTITGTGFTGATGVSIGGAAATSVTVVSATSITATTPAGTAGTASVVVTTPAGSNTANSLYTYVTPAPTVSGISPSSGTTLGGAAVTITGTGFTGATGVSIGGAAATSVTVVSATSITATTPAGTAGTVDITVTNPGGTSLISSRDRYTYVAPPTITALSQGVGPLTGNTFVTISGTNLINATGVSFGGTAGSNLSCSATTCTVSTPAHAAGATDVVITTVGGSATLTAGFTYLAPPTVTSISPASGPSTGGTAVTISGTNFFTGMTVQIGGSNASSIVVASATSLTAVTPASQGAGGFVTATTPGGSTSIIGAPAFNYVLPTPTVTGISPSVAATGSIVTLAGANLTGITSVSFGGTAATVASTYNGGLRLDVFVPAGLSGTVDITVTTASGTSATSSADRFTPQQPLNLAISVTPANIAVGGTAALSLKFTNPNSIPVSPPSGLMLGTPFPTGGFAGDCGATVTNAVPGNYSFPGATVPANSSCTITATVQGSAPGAGVFSTVAVVGVNATPSGTVTVSPLVTAISPPSGPATGGTPVVISGAGFTGATAVKFGGSNAASFTINGATSITAIAPAGAGLADITVTANGETSATSTADQYTYVNAPAVTGVTPASGTTLGGAAVTITGTGFTGATGVTIGGAAATSVTVVSSTSITATTPAGTSGTASVVVTTPAGSNTANGLYTYVTPAPTVSAISPSSGTTLGGAAVTITGTGFTGATGVSIGGAAATSVTVVSSTSITATTPAGTAGTASVVVTTPAGSNVANSLYTYVTPAPTVSGISPSSGTTLGGAAVTITGMGFTGATGVSIGGTAATSVTVVSSTSITATTPAGTAGTASVVVTTPAGSDVANSLYTYVTPAPTVTGVSATVGYNASATPITLALGGGAASSVAVATPATHGTATASGTSISYTPTAGYYGPDSFTYTASGSGGTSTPATVSVMVSTPVIAFGQTTVPNGQQSIAYSTTLTASGGTGPYSFALQAGSTLPTGLNLSSGGVISGTPGAQGNFSFTVVASDSSAGAGPATGSRTFSLTLGAPPAPTATAKALSISVSTSATGGASVAPTNIDLSTSVTNATGIVILTAPQHGTAKVSGFVVTYTPTAGYFGTDSFTYAAIGLPGSSASALLSPNGLGSPAIFGAGAGVGAGSGSALSVGAVVNISIPAPTVVIQPTSLPNGQATVAYSQTLTASGGTAPYSFTISAGALPAGLTLSPVGVISGTPLAAGPFTFTVKATDSSTGSGPFSATQSFTLTLAPLLPTAPSLTVQVAADKIGTANITAGATNGPFTGGTVVSVTPASAGTASIALTSGTAGVSATYAMNFTPTLHFSGNAVVSYTLSNAYAASAPATVTFQVAARPDPTLDPDVKGLIQAQNDTAIRFAEAQLSNFNQRLESLHSGGPGSNRNGISLQFGDGAEQPGPDQDPFRNWDKAGLPKYFGANDRLDQPQGLGSKPTTGLSGHAGGPTGSGGPHTLGSNLQSNSAAAADGSTGAGDAGGVSLWTGGSIDFGMHRSGATRSGLKFSTAGISIGGDYRVSDTLTLGLGGGYGQDKTNIGSSGSQDKATAYVGAVYGSWHPSEKAFIDGVLGYSQLHYDTRRYYAAASEYEFGKRTGDEWFGSLTAAWEIRHARSLIAPYGRLDAIEGTLDAFTERGGVGALAYGSETVRSLKSTLGVHGDYLYPTQQGIWQPRFRVEYQHEFQDPSAFALQYADWLSGPTYRGILDGRGRDQLVLGLGTDFRTRDVTLSLDYKTDATRSSQTTSEVAAKGIWKF